MLLAQEFLDSVRNLRTKRLVYRYLEAKSARSRDAGNAGNTAVEERTASSRPRRSEGRTGGCAPRCAGTVMPLRRNGDAVAPEPLCRLAEFGCSGTGRTTRIQELFHPNHVKPAPKLESAPMEMRTAVVPHPCMEIGARRIQIRTGLRRPGDAGIRVQNAARGKLPLEFRQQSAPDAASAAVLRHVNGRLDTPVIRFARLEGTRIGVSGHAAGLLRDQIGIIPHRFRQASGDFRRVRRLVFEGNRRIFHIRRINRRDSRGVRGDRRTDCHGRMRTRRPSRR